MYVISIPCHSCGHDNPAEALHCAECRAVIRLRLRSTTATQQLPPVSTANTSEEELVKEAFLVVALLLQSAHRLRALIDVKRSNR